MHGVKGSDAAHKACAALSDTEYFVTVDADNIVDPAFLEIEVDIDAMANTTDTGASAGYGNIKWTLQNAKPSGTYQ